MFLVRGKFWNKGYWQKFEKEINAKSEEEAVEKAYSLLGSHHKVKRTKIIIEEVKKVGKGGKERDKS
ncbi:MAG: 50S ribosomal protein L18a [Nanoarchaeota archaeon]|nr:50S ribosomal protein L18a [Nanoarchaeota archaeon]